jgi:hypothetical protein
MAFLSEYGGIKPDMLKDKPYETTIETIRALLLLYPLYIEEYTHEGVTIHFFQKSLWGKKQKGFLKLEYLPGQHNDSIDSLNPDRKTLAAYSDLLIGMEYGSAYDSVYWTEQFCELLMNSPHKQVLNYGILFEILNLKKNSISQLKLEIMRANNTSMWDTSTMDRIGFYSREEDLYKRVASLLKVFEKFHQKSNLHPAGSEQ